MPFDLLSAQMAQYESNLLKNAHSRLYTQNHIWMQHNDEQ